MNRVKLKVLFSQQFRTGFTNNYKLLNHNIMAIYRLGTLDIVEHVYGSSLAQDELNRKSVHGHEGALDLLGNSITEILPV